MPKIQNCTARPRQLNARAGKVGMISVSFAPDEIKDLSRETLDILKTNPANARWFQLKLFVEVKDDSKTETKIVENVDVSKKKIKTGKKKSDKDLGL